MRIVMVEPGHYARIGEIENTLSAEQEAVGGLIDCAYPWKEEACIVCNDEGLLNGMPLNRFVASYGPIAGPFFVCGIRGEEFCSLTKEQAAYYQNMFLRPQFFINTKKGIAYGEYDNVTLSGRRKNPYGVSKNEGASRNIVTVHCPAQAH